MSMISHRSWAASGDSLSSGERREAHWNSLAAAHKRRILFYLARRFVRRAPQAAAELGKTAIIELIDWARWARAYMLWFALAVAKLVKEFGDPKVRRELAETADSIQTVRFLREAFPLIVMLLALTMAAGLSRRDAPSIVEQARLVRNHPPPPCISDGDGGVWIDVGESYVKQRDENYARLRRELCGY